MQVYGGYGYTREYPIEQLARDCKIASIYEGTDGIQAMDLLGRKLGMNEGKVFMGFMGDVQKTIARAREAQGLETLADKLEKALNRLGETAMHLGKKGVSPEFKTAFAHAFPFLETMGDVIMAWMLLWRASIAAEKLNNGAKKKDVNFYEGQLKSAQFFIQTVIPVACGKMDAIMDGSNAAVEISEAAFGGL